MVLGRTAAGKTAFISRLLNSTHSSLIQTRFPPNFTETTIPEIKFSLFDQDGLKIGTYGEQTKELEDLLKKTNSSFDPADHFDVVLMVLPSMSVKWESVDLELTLKIIREWGLPLAIVLSRFQGVAKDFEIDPKAFPKSDPEKAILRDFDRYNITDVELYRVNSEPHMKGEETVFEIGGFERMVEGLKDLIWKGLNRTMERIEMNRKKAKQKIVNESVDACRNRCDELFVSPVCPRIANRNVSLEMIVRLLEFAKVEKEGQNETAVKLFDAFQEGLVPRYSGFVIGFVQNIELWIDYLVGGGWCQFQMRRLGEDVIDLLEGIDGPEDGIKGEVVEAAIPRHRR
jgi:hypothetical protein